MELKEGLLHLILQGLTIFIKIHTKKKEYFFYIMETLQIQFQFHR